MISAHNLPKTRDERCVPQAWDEFESPCDFAQLPLTTADVASPMCEVELLGGRVGPGTQWTVMGGVAPPWEQALGLDGIDPLSSPVVKDRWTKTSAAVPDNGLNPQWSQVNFACAVWSPEQTLLKVSIYNMKSSPNPYTNPKPSPNPDPNPSSNPNAAQGVHLQLEEQPARQGLEGAARLRDGPGVRAA